MKYGADYVLNAASLNRSLVPLLAFTLVSFIGSQTLADDPYAGLWQAHAEAIRTIEATFQHQTNDNPPRDYNLRMDLQTGYFEGTVFKPKTHPDGTVSIADSSYGLTEKLSWYSYLMPDGTHRFDFNSVEKPFFPRETKLSSLGYPWLKWAFMPFHTALQPESADRYELHISLTSDSPATLPGAARRLVYRITLRSGQNETAWDVSYDADLSDGVRIYRTEVRTPEGQLETTIENKDFTKLDGIWVAFKTICQGFDYASQSPSQTPAPSRTLRTTIKEIAFNRSYTAEDFKPHPAVGDFIFDSIVKTQYRLNAPRDLLPIAESFPLKQPPATSPPLTSRSPEPQPEQTATSTASPEAPAQPTDESAAGRPKWPQRLAIVASALILLLAAAVALIFLATRLAPTLKRLIARRPPKNRA